MGDFLPELVCMGVDMVICGVLHMAIKSAENSIKDLSNAPEIVINEDLIKSIQNHPSCIVDEESNTKTLPYATIRGDVAPMEQAINSNYAEDLVGVIQKVSFIEHKKKLNKSSKWIHSTHTIANYTNESPFCLTNPQVSSYFVFEEPWRSQLDVWAKNSNPTWDSIEALGRPHVQVMNIRSANIDLDTVFDQFEPAGAGMFGKHIMGTVVGDMHKGVQTIERMLTKGTTLTGIGELTAGPDGIILQPPSDGRSYYLVKDSLHSLIRGLESNRYFLEFALKIFLSIGVVISGAALWKLYRKKKASNDMNEQLDMIRANRDSHDHEVNNDDDDGGNIMPESLQCVVCLGAEREVILLDCGHVCVCADCADQLIKGSHPCPVCRANIATIRPAYVS